MAKKKLNKNSRELILNWMIKEKINENEGIDKLLSQLQYIIELINPIIRRKYPEEDMKILRKYKATRIDKCLKFCGVDSTIFAFDFNYKYGEQFSIKNKFNNLIEDMMADMPSCGGCNNQIVFEGTMILKKAIDNFDKFYGECRRINRNKEIKYRSFINSCKYIEEIEAVIPLSEDIRTKIKGECTILTVINPELLKSIKEDFECKKI